MIQSYIQPKQNEHFQKGDIGLIEPNIELSNKKNIVQVNRITGAKG